MSYYFVPSLLQPIFLSNRFRVFSRIVIADFSKLLHDLKVFLIKIGKITKYTATLQSFTSLGGMNLQFGIFLTFIRKF